METPQTHIPAYKALIASRLGTVINWACVSPALYSLYSCWLCAPRQVVQHCGLDCVPPTERYTPVPQIVTSFKHRVIADKLAKMRSWWVSPNPI